jgi:hypothetical protein
MWIMFRDIIKHNTRYVFFRLSNVKNPDPCDLYQNESPHQILDRIADTAKLLSLFTTIKKESIFYRGVTYGEDEKDKIKLPDRVTSPPDNKASANRMSAEGISIFYGAADKETVLAEIPHDNAYAVVAQFECLRDLLILDLTSLRDRSIPDYFDMEERDKREGLIFLQELEKELTQPIRDRNLNGNIEYVPSQVITEYFRHLYKVDGSNIDGIAYRSAERENGVCYALFFNQNQCLPRGEKPQVLNMVADKIEHYKLKPKWYKI